MKYFLLPLLFTLSSAVSAQCYNCGMFGLLMDNFDEVYVARFTTELDSIQLESARTCNILTVPVTLESVKQRSIKTTIYMKIEHPRFDGASYRIKYPTGSWGVVTAEVQ